MDEMLQEFIGEALELSTEVEEQLLRLEKSPDDLNVLNAVFRAFHTIKGGAGFMDLRAVVGACHLTENLFDALRLGHSRVSSKAIEAALQANSFVAQQLQQLLQGIEPENLSDMPVDLAEMLTQASVEGQAREAHEIDESTSTTILEDRKSKLPKSPPSDADNLDWLAYWQAVTGSDVDCEPLVPANAHPIVSQDVSPEGGGSLVIEETLRVKAQKLDELLEVAGESVQAANQASALLEKLRQYKQEDAVAALMTTLSETLARAARYTSELQRATLATRMQPVGRLFQRFPRLVRELAKELDKDVELLIEGAETEVDRVVVDSMYEPMVHMLRNSLDHGVESRDARRESGKPEKATIRLGAWQEASSVVIEVSDDGAGIDAQKLFDKAVASGLLDVTQEFQHEQALQLIFRPGLSLKDQATKVSGRGVGMDVVKTTVEKHRGGIHIESELGKGTRFCIRLPIDLSIVPTMLVSAGQVLLGMPMAAVERVIQLPAKQLALGGAPIVRDQGRHLPVKSLASVLGYEPALEQLGLVVACSDPYVLSVCCIEGTADLVIKPMTSIRARGIAGTARSAEGVLVLVLDVAFLMSGANAV